MLATNTRYEIRKTGRSLAVNNLNGKSKKENSEIFKKILDLGTGPRYEHGIYVWDYMDNSRQLFEEVFKAFNKFRALFGTEESEPENTNNNNNIDLSSQESDTESI